MRTDCSIVAGAWVGGSARLGISCEAVWRVVGDIGDMVSDLAEASSWVTSLRLETRWRRDLAMPGFGFLLNTVEREISGGRTGNVTMKEYNW